jgi:hypothetical protein
VHCCTDLMTIRQTPTFHNIYKLQKHVSGADPGFQVSRAEGGIIRFYLSLVRSVAYGKSEVKLFVCKEITNRW